VHQVTAEIIENKESGPYMLMRLKVPEIAKDAQPGQFVMLQLKGAPHLPLRRPFGIHDTWFREQGKQEPDGILVLYQVVGRGTRLMSQMTPGENFSLVGPLGRGFTTASSERLLLVAGGVGIAPLRFLARMLKSTGSRTELLAGARTEELLYIGDFHDTDEITLTTDDGSKGIRGPVTAALEAVLDEDCSAVSIYASGPSAMLQRVADLAALYEVPCELSLESVMACGIGACHGCAIKAIGEDGEPTYLRVCKEGPVFDSRRVISF
jgi:dihydroorotate dehydrogenase electron transfer subunit